MSFLQALLLSFIQSATEFLPVSSSGHLLFMKGALGLTNVPLIFDILIHVGSLIAILVFYRHRLAQTVSGLLTEVSKEKRIGEEGRWAVFLILATGVTFAMYLLGGDLIEARFERPSTLPVTYLLTTVILGATYFAPRTPKRKTVQLTWQWIVMIGFFQAMAMLPGVSRSGSTIAPLLLLGVMRKDAGYFAFSLAIPAILGAFIFELTDAAQLTYLTTHPVLCLAALAVSAGASYGFLKMIDWVLGKKTFWYFSFYTMGMAVLSFILFGVS